MRTPTSLKERLLIVLIGTIFDIPMLGLIAPVFVDVHVNGGLGAVIVIALLWNLVANVGAGMVELLQLRAGCLPTLLNLFVIPAIALLITAGVSNGTLHVGSFGSALALAIIEIPINLLAILIVTVVIAWIVLKIHSLRS